MNEGLAQHPRPSDTCKPCVSGGEVAEPEHTKLGIPVVISAVDGVLKAPQT